MLDYYEKTRTSVSTNHTPKQTMSHILIVEDNIEIANLYAQVFARHQTVVLNDVPEALVYLQEVRPDLVITDFHLPSRSGGDIVTYIRSTPALRDIPVIGISMDDMLKWEAKERGVDTFLIKPIDIAELYNTAHRLLNSVRKSPTAEMQAALKDYAAAYQKAYNTFPKGTWTGTHVIIEDEPRDESWLRSETQRLREMVAPVKPSRSYLYRLIDKLRRM